MKQLLFHLIKLSDIFKGTTRFSGNASELHPSHRLATDYISTTYIWRLFKVALNNLIVWLKHKIYGGILCFPLYKYFRSHFTINKANIIKDLIIANKYRARYCIQNQMPIIAYFSLETNEFSHSYIEIWVHKYVSVAKMMSSIHNGRKICYHLTKLKKKII